MERSGQKRGFGEAHLRAENEKKIGCFNELKKKRFLKTTNTPFKSH